MKIVIQKFGGTSLRENEDRRMAAAHVKEKLDQGFYPVVVVSALGRVGDPYATDSLLSLTGNVHDQDTGRERDLISSCGEVIAAVVMSHVLQEEGMAALALTGAQAGIITDSNFGNCRIRSINPARILDTLASGKVPVVAGFQGISTSGELTTLGRGGSDTTACYLGAALKADSIEIYTDVAGVMTGDPRKINQTRIIDQLSYSEVVEMAYLGARVIHPRAVEIAAEHNIPVKILPNQSGKDGTIIRDFPQQQPITGVTSKDRITFVRILPRHELSREQDLQVFQALARADISLDFINIRPQEISFIIDRSCREAAETILKNSGVIYHLQDDYVKISLVGAGMTGQPGVLARIVEVLYKNKIDIYETTDSHTTISCLIKADQEKKALQVLHDTLIAHKI
ncbi:MAG: aspartate kinase [Candidatus Cloacimonetes bacterium]|nr:aspartate kinase [Candidatus Cloacimonadota bacterium]